MEKVDAIILAGGLGTRLRGVLTGIPKALAPINNRPFLDIILSFLNRWDFIGRVVIAVGHMAEKILNEYEGKASYNYEILFSVEEKLLGTGGGIKKALQSTNTDTVLALNGDSYIDVDMGNLLGFHKGHDSDLTIVLKEMKDSDRYGLVRLDADGRIISFEEKRPERRSGYINAGVYAFKRELFDGVREDETVSIEEELFPSFLKKSVYGYVSRGMFIDIGVPETYEMAADFFKGVN